MAIYNDDKHNFGMEGSFNKKSNKGNKAKENKQRLVNEIIDNLWENLYESEEYIKDLVEESLMRRTQKDLKEINA